MNNHEAKVTAVQTKNWQPLMNKLSARSRRQRRRLMQKRIRRGDNKNDNT